MTKFEFYLNHSHIQVCERGEGELSFEGGYPFARLLNTYVRHDASNIGVQAVHA